MTLLDITRVKDLVRSHERQRDFALTKANEYRSFGDYDLADKHEQNAQSHQEIINHYLSLMEDDED